MKYAGVSILIIIALLFVFGQIKYGPFHYVGFYNVFSPTNINEAIDISYGEHPRLKLDIYFPDKEIKKKNKVVFFIHGGAWDSNSKDSFKFIGKALAQNGYTAVLPNYRLAPEYKHPAQIKDIAQALKWTEKNISNFGGNEKEIVISGHSAGGHLAALIGYGDKWQQKYDINKRNIRALVLLAGVYKFADKYEEGSEPVKNFVPKNLWEDAQPVHYLDSSDPPTYILHGLKDETVIPKQSYHLAKKLTEKGIEHKSILKNELNHISLLFSFGNKSNDIWDEFSLNTDEK